MEEGALILAGAMGNMLTNQQSTYNFTSTLRAAGSPQLIWDSYQKSTDASIKLAFKHCNTNPPSGEQTSAMVSRVLHNLSTQEFMGEAVAIMVSDDADLQRLGGITMVPNQHQLESLSTTVCEATEEAVTVESIFPVIATVYERMHQYFIQKDDAIKQGLYTTFGAALTHSPYSAYRNHILQSNGIYVHLSNMQQVLTNQEVRIRYSDYVTLHV